MSLFYKSWIKKYGSQIKKGAVLSCYGTRFIVVDKADIRENFTTVTGILLEMDPFFISTIGTQSLHEGWKVCTQDETIHFLREVNSNILNLINSIKINYNGSIENLNGFTNGTLIKDICHEDLFCIVRAYDNREPMTVDGIYINLYRKIIGISYVSGILVGTWEVATSDDAAYLSKLINIKLSEAFSSIKP
jgi:hypothetical protein